MNWLFWIIWILCSVLAYVVSKALIAKMTGSCDSIDKGFSATFSLMGPIALSAMGLIAAIEFGIVGKILGKIGRCLP